MSKLLTPKELTTRRCWDCRQELSIENFCRHSRMPGGYNYQCRACCATYQQRNRDKIKRNFAVWYGANVARVRANAKRWKTENRERYLQIVRLDSAKRRASKLSAPVCDFTLGEWKILCDEFGQLCAYCGEPKPLTQDHIQPLSRSGSHTYSNIVPSCITCNTSKQARTADEFLTAA